jgi:hypothetical protein
MTVSRMMIGSAATSSALPQATVAIIAPMASIASIRAYRGPFDNFIARPLTSFVNYPLLR